MKYFLYGILTACLVASCSHAIAHEMTPTYPKWIPSHVPGIMKSQVEMFNKREDVEFYEVGIFDSDFNPIPFVSQYKVFKLEYLGHVTIELYIREEDRFKAEYVCSKSKLRKSKDIRTAISSKICSRFK